MNNDNNKENNSTKTNTSVSSLSLIDLQKQNKSLTDELTAVTRNFEALCLKVKEQTNLIKRLQDELNHSKSKETKTELEMELKMYKEKYEQLANSIGQIESKYQTSSQNCKKYQENEVRYKVMISKLENRLRIREKLESQNNQLKKQNEQSLQLVLEENKKLENLINKYKEENKELIEKAEDASNLAEQMKKENELIYKLLDETREKLKLNDKLIEELSIKIKNGSNSEDNKNYKLLYNDVLKGYNTIKEENENMNKKYNELNNYILSIKSNFTSKLTIESKIILSLNNNNIPKVIDKKFINDYMRNQINFQNNETEIKINTALTLFENKLQLITSKINQIQSMQINNSKLQEKEKNNMINELLSKQTKYINEINDLTNKLTKVKLKKKTLKTENITLSQTILSLREKQSRLVDMTEIQKLFTYIKSIIDRLKLTMETFSINLNCKNCYEMKTKLNQLNCGHTICEECSKVENSCIECGSNIIKSQCSSNVFSEQIIARYKYAKQQIESDIDLVISSLSENFNKHN